MEHDALRAPSDGDDDYTSTALIALRVITDSTKIPFDSNLRRVWPMPVVTGDLAVSNAPTLQAGRWET